MIAIVVVVLAVLAIPMLGILAAIAIPNFLTAMQRSKQKSTMVDMRALAQDLETQAATAGSYPGNLPERKRDGWNTELRYECIAEGDRPCAGYAITSAGKDQQFEYESVQQYSRGPSVKFDCDIVYANGQFIQYPEGSQR